MASDVPTTASLGRKVHLLWLVLFDPEAFETEEAKDNARLNGTQARDNLSNVRRVRRALGQSLFWCAISLAAGFFAGLVAFFTIGNGGQVAVAVVVVGTAIILWATFALQGWSIQTYGGVTLSERANQWIFRSLYALGTFFIVLGSVWLAA